MADNATSQNHRAVNPEETRRSEPHWGDPNRSQVRRDTTRRERIAGIAWLSVGAAFGLFVSVLYLGSRISIGEVSIPLPWTILFAGVFNWIITKTALLWTPNKAIAAIPTWIWLAGFIALLMWPALSSSGGYPDPAKHHHARPARSGAAGWRDSGHVYRPHGRS